MSPSGRDGSPHLSLQQAEFLFYRWWEQFQGRLSPDAGNIAFSIALKGNINAAALQSAADALTARHSVFGLCFPQDAGALLNVPGRVFEAIGPSLMRGERAESFLSKLAAAEHLHILDSPPFKVAKRATSTRVSLREYSCGHRDPQEIRLIVQNLMKQPFDLAHECLMRIGLIQQHHDEVVLVIVSHYLVMDGWSFGIILRELLLLSQHRLTLAQPYTLPELKLEYSDFAHWQRQRLDGPLLNDLVRFWKLHDATAMASSVRWPCAAGQLFVHGEELITLGVTTTRALGDRARDERVTLFALTLTIFGVVLANYTDSLAG